MANPSRSPLTYGMDIKKKPVIKNPSQAGSLSCWMNEQHQTFHRVSHPRFDSEVTQKSNGFMKLFSIMKKSSLISILPQILLSHKEWFESGGKDGIFADLNGEDLREGNFKNAVLVEANLQGADLRGVNFENADLRGANLQDAQLKGACLKNANFEETYKAYIHFIYVV